MGSPRPAAWLPRDRPRLVVLVWALAALVAPPTGSAALHHQHQLGQIRSSIVEALGLTSLPDPAKANVSQAEYERAHKEYLTRLRRSAEGDARQRRLFTMYAEEEQSREGSWLSFPLSLEEADSGSTLVESATLRLLVDHDESAGGVEVRVYRSRGRREPRLLASRPFAEARQLRRRWLEFDLSDEVADALDAAAPLALLVQVLHKEEKERLAQGRRVARAALNVHALLESRPRSRRSAGGGGRRQQLMALHRSRRTECRGEGKKCCRHSLSITFKELEGFDFVIQPISFDLGYCKGRCPPRFNPAHHHALLQSLIWKEDRRKAPRPCCAPSKLAQLEVLYMDEKDATKLKMANWKDMRVLECACS